MLGKWALGPSWGGLMCDSLYIGTASMLESVHMSTGSVSKFRHHETIDRKGEIREM